jgi:hypothetical protein
VYTRAGPDGWRELRTAIPPSGSAATSTQFPLGLLRLLLRQSASSRSAGTPLLAGIDSSSLEDHGNKCRIGLGKITGSPHGASAHCRCTAQPPLKEIAKSVDIGSWEGSGAADIAKG